jgi:hypothetical protein
MQMAKRIRVLYFEGCPSFQLALKNLREVISEDGLTAEIEMVRIESVEDGAVERFFGSPTIQIDGQDLEGAIAASSAEGLGCRIYSEGNTVRGWPSKQFIRGALRGCSSRALVNDKGWHRLE